MGMPFFISILNTIDFVRRQAITRSQEILLAALKTG
jgi:hypothetical protein